MERNNREYIIELFKIVSTTSILVVDNKGKLKRIHTPFQVVAIVDAPPHIHVGELYYVESVKMTLDLKEVYIIGGKGYFIDIFRIL